MSVISKLKTGIRMISNKALQKKYFQSEKVQSNKVLFFTFQGEYTCNPKYICDRAIKENRNWDMVWVVNEDITDTVKQRFPKEVRLVKKGSAEFYKELASSKIWVDNAFNVVRYTDEKKQGQYYVETMHGSLGLKRIGPEDFKNDPARNERGFACGRMSDYIISNSDFENMVYETSFWKDTTIWKIGHARNDVLSHLDDESRNYFRKKVRDFYHLSEDTSIIMYAPTFADGSMKEMIEKGNYEKFDPEMVYDEVTKKFGGKWVVFMRLHHRERAFENTLTFNEHIINAGNYPDMQELMIAIDLGITDYSSWIYDYILTYNPGFLFAPTLPCYNEQRGFYYKIETTPFPVSQTNAVLCEQIRNFDNEKYLKDVDAFLADKGCVDDGHACERIVAKLQELMDK